MVLFRGLADHYDKVLDYLTLFQDRYWKSWLITTVSINKNWKILDLGCGTCVLEKHLCRKGCSVIGLDLSEEMLRIAQRKNLDCIDSFFVGDAEYLPFNESTFDAVLSCYIVKYCNWDRLVLEIRRILKPAGKLILYDFSSPKGFFAPFHAFYIYGVMRLLGKFLRYLNSNLAFTLVNLPNIITIRRWDESFDKILFKHGFSRIRSKRLSGGVVTAFWASRS
jgi:demethylmenaquinone methyltransferase/2-methoxy-6-polyprenyl-1,4-benzoquinol methylase